MKSITSRTPNSERTICVVIYEVATSERTICCLTWVVAKPDGIGSRFFTTSATASLRLGRNYCYAVLPLIIEVRFSEKPISMIEGLCTVLFASTLKDQGQNWRVFKSLTNENKFQWLSRIYGLYEPWIIAASVHSLCSLKTPALSNWIILS